MKTIDSKLAVATPWSRLPARKLLTISVMVIGAVVANAQPIQVPRYDDADEYLPKAQEKNTSGIRLFLRQQEGEELFKVPTPRNVTIDIIAKVPADAEFGVVFLLGGTGVLSIQNERLDRSFSFQPRSRDYWWAHKAATFLVDAPSDKLDKEGIQDTAWRAGAQHRQDLKAVLDAVAARFKGPLVIHGHSNGAHSAANAASLRHDAVKAYVLSSSAHYNRPTTIIEDTEYNQPVIFVQHKQDNCKVSATSQFDRLVEKIKAPKKLVLMGEGGVPSMSGACGPFAPHSFVGVEKTIIDQQIRLIQQVLSK